MPELSTLAALVLLAFVLLVVVAVAVRLRPQAGRHRGPSLPRPRKAPEA